MSQLLGRAAVLLGIEQTLKHGLPLAFAEWNAFAGGDAQGAEGASDLVLPTITADAVEIHPEALPKISDLEGDSDALCRITSAPGGSFARYGAQGGDRVTNVTISIAIRHRNEQGARSAPSVLEIFANAAGDAVASALDGLEDSEGKTVCLDGLPYGVWHWDEGAAQVDFLTVQDTTSEPTGLLLLLQYAIKHTSAH